MKSLKELQALLEAVDAPKTFAKAAKSKTPPPDAPSMEDEEEDTPEDSGDDEMDDDEDYMSPSKFKKSAAGDAEAVDMDGAAVMGLLLDMHKSVNAMSAKIEAAEEAALTAGNIAAKALIQKSVAIPGKLAVMTPPPFTDEQLKQIDDVFERRFKKSADRIVNKLLIAQTVPGMIPVDGDETTAEAAGVTPDVLVDRFNKSVLRNPAISDTRKRELKDYVDGTFYNPALLRNGIPAELNS